MKQLLIIFLLGAQLIARAQDTTCSNITRTYDEFEKQTTLQTPILKNCGLTKVISEKGATYYLSLNAKGSMPSIGQAGVKVILSYNQMLSFPTAEIDIAVAESGYEYSAFIPLNADQLETLTKFKVLKWRLYVFDQDQSSEDGWRFKDQVNCLVKMK